LLCGLKALLVAVLDVRLRLGLSPTTSLSPKWRAYIAAFPARQARRSAFRLDIAGYFPRLRTDSFLTRTQGRTKESFNYL
jgi:hypothetical protein